MQDREDMSQKLAEVAGAIHELSEVRQKKGRSLESAMNVVRERQADRDDVVVDMAHAERSRLELLAGELQPVFDAIDDRIDMFDIAITNGTPPRLWIDMTSCVTMGADRRTYRLLKDTRLGRTVLAESRDLNVMADHVTDYIAERVLMRERMMEGEWLSLRQQTVERMEAQETGSASDLSTDYDGKSSKALLAGARSGLAADDSARAAGASKKKSGSWLSFFLGIMFGAIALFTWAWWNVPPAL